jgi:hypothetical protein
MEMMGGAPGDAFKVDGVPPLTGWAGVTRPGKL